MKRFGVNARIRCVAAGVLLGVLAFNPAVADETAGDRGPRLTPDLSIDFNQSSFDARVPDFGNTSGISFGSAILSDIEAFLFVEVGGGASIPVTGASLTGFGQTLRHNVGINGFAGIGTIMHPAQRPFAYEAGLRLDALSMSPRAVTNNPPVVGSLAVGGSHTAISISPRFGLVRRLGRRSAVYAGVSGGVAFQNLKVTTGAGTVLSGAGTTPTVSIDGGIRLPLADGVSADFGGAARWLGGFQARTNTGVTTMTGGRLVGTLRASIRVTLDPRRRARLISRSATRLDQGAASRLLRRR